MIEDNTLSALGVRIEQLTQSPDSIAAPLTRLLRPLYQTFGWRPSLTLVHFTALISQRRGVADPLEVDQLLQNAIDELEDNVQQIERATIINRRPLISYAAWARRVYEALGSIHRGLTGAGPLLLRRDHHDYLVPMSLQPRTSKGDAIEAPEETPDFEMAETHLVGFQLDAIDELLALAQSEDHGMARRRRLLQAARQMLLETSAVMEVSGGGVEDRLMHISVQLTRLNGMQALGLRPEAGILYQARSALTRRERNKLHAALSLMNSSALVKGDERVADLTRIALDKLIEQSAYQTPVDGVDAAAHGVLGERIVDAVTAGYEDMRAEGEEHHGIIADVILRYAAPGLERASLSCALSVDGCFDMGGAMTPVQIREEVPRQRQVRHPTADLRVVPAQGPEDIQAALIHDPRSVMMDLAAGRLLTRRYARTEIVSQNRTIMQGEVRVYLLDGSGSMLGARARMRDAILTAELATLARKLEDPNRRTRVVVYFRYFNEEVGPVFRVDSTAGALTAIREITGTIQSGGTDLQGALLASMHQVRDEERADPDLKRAQIVLVTDGEAILEREVVERARASIQGVPLGISVIALGIENPALREIVANQRRAGDRAFYHFLPDHLLRRICDGTLDPGAPLHLPSVPDKDWDQGELEVLLDELTALERARRADEPLEGEAARLLDQSFKGWFPAPASPAASEDANALLPEDGTMERRDLESVFVLLATVADVMETLGDTPMERMRDGVAVLERLLPHTQLSPGRYREILRLYGGALRTALEGIHRAVGP